MAIRSQHYSSECHREYPLSTHARPKRISAFTVLSISATAITIIVGWVTLGGPLPATTSHIQVVQAQIDAINKRIDGIELLNLYNERSRVEDEIDDLRAKQEVESNPGARAARRYNIKVLERRVKEIDRQIDARQ